MFWPYFPYFIINVPNIFSVICMRWQIRLQDLFDIYFGLASLKWFCLHSMGGASDLPLYLNNHQRRLWIVAKWIGICLKWWFMSNLGITILLPPHHYWKSIFLCCRWLEKFLIWQTRSIHIQCQKCSNAEQTPGSGCSIFLSNTCGLKITLWPDHHPWTVRLL